MTTPNSYTFSRAVVRNSRLLGREAPIAGRDVPRPDRDSLELARGTPLSGREAHIHGTEYFRAVWDHCITDRDGRIASSNSLIRDRVAMNPVGIQRISGSIPLNSFSAIRGLGTINAIGDTVTTKFARLGLNIVSITLNAGSIGRIADTS